MPAVAYQDVLGQAERLSPDDQLRLVEELAAHVRRQMPTGKKHSIKELRGLGKEIWGGIDAQEYVNQERESWGGPDDLHEK
jgi:hypothetical protein